MMAKEITREEILSDPLVVEAINKAKQEVIDSMMESLSPEQKEYVDLKITMNRMNTYYLKLKKEGKIAPCLPHGTSPFGQTKYLVEGLFYGYLEQLQSEKQR